MTSFTRALMDVGTARPFTIACGIAGLMLVVVFRMWWPGFAVGFAVVAAGELCGLLKEHIQRAATRRPLARLV